MNPDPRPPTPDGSPPEPTYRAVIFDMDGVLVDSEPLHWAAMNRALGDAGPPVDEAEYRGYIGASAGETWQKLLARRGLPGPAAPYLARYDEAVVAVVAAQAAPMPGLRPLLAALRAAGVPCAVGSTSPRRWVEATLARIGMADAFAIVVSREMVARGKPAPDIFLRAADLLGVPAAACVVVEDSPRGLQAARAAGAFVVALRHPPGMLGAIAQPAPADLIVDSLAEFQAWWQELSGA